jgi:hypothetical protein
LNTLLIRGEQGESPRDNTYRGFFLPARVGGRAREALLVGLALWHLKGLRRDNSFLVSNLMLEEWRIQPDAKRRALGALEKAGLIAIERRGKRSPQVTLVVGKSAKGIT